MKTVIIYDDSTCAKQANAMLRRASERAETDGPWNVSPWRLDMLGSPSLTDEAMADAAEAHLIVLAFRCMENVDNAVLNWLEDWAKRRKVDDAALAMFEAGSSEAFSTEAAAGLYAFTRRHGLNFILGDKASGLGRTGLPALTWR